MQSLNAEPQVSETYSASVISHAVSFVQPERHPRYYRWDRVERRDFVSPAAYYRLVTAWLEMIDQFVDHDGSDIGHIEPWTKSNGISWRCECSPVQLHVANM